MPRIWRGRSWLIALIAVSALGLSWPGSARADFSININIGPPPPVVVVREEVDLGYHLIFNAGSYEATTTVLMIDGQYSRMLYLEEVRRNADKDISDSGDVDDNIRKVTIAVSWQDGRGTTTKKISTYVTNLFKN